MLGKKKKKKRTQFLRLCRGKTNKEAKNSIAVIYAKVCFQSNSPSQNLLHFPFITFLFYFHSESEEKHGAADQMKNFELVAEMHRAATGTLHTKCYAVFANQ